MKMLLWLYGHPMTDARSILHQAIYYNVLVQDFFPVFVQDFERSALSETNFHYAGFVYTHFKSCYQSLHKKSFDFPDIFHAMNSYAPLSPKSSMILKVPKNR